MARPIRCSDSASLAKARLGAALSTATGTSPNGNGLTQPMEVNGPGAGKMDRKPTSREVKSN